MYKSDLRQALTQLDLIPDGIVADFLEAAREAESGLYSASAFIAANNENSRSSGPAKVQTALVPLMQAVKAASPRAAFHELHQLSDRFERVMADYPELYSFLTIGNDALSALSITYDEAVSNNKSHAFVALMVRPAAQLYLCYTHYDALKHVFGRSNKNEIDADDISSTIEIDGVYTLFDFSKHLSVIALLGEAAKQLTTLDQNVPYSTDSEIIISSIESGSPTRISLFGDGKAIELLLAMIRDAARIAYQHLTKHGRVIQSSEVYELLQKKGIDSPQAIAVAKEAVDNAVAAWATSANIGRAKLSIDGRAITKTDAAFLLSGPIAKEEDGDIARLSGPGENDEN